MVLPAAVRAYLRVLDAGEDAGRELERLRALVRPAGPRRDRRARWAEVARLRAEGLSQSEAAKRTGYTKRRVQAIERRLKREAAANEGGEG